jgi:hypothetical protein
MQFRFLWFRRGIKPKARGVLKKKKKKKKKDYRQVAKSSEKNELCIVVMRGLSRGVEEK